MGNRTLPFKNEKIRYLKNQKNRVRGKLNIYRVSDGEKSRRENGINTEIQLMTYKVLRLLVLLCYCFLLDYILYNQKSLILNLNEVGERKEE